MLTMFCAVAFLPAMRCAGSPPGTTMKITKTMNVTARQTRIAPMMRRTKNVSTLVLHLDLCAWVERIAEPVAEDVQREDGQQDRDAGSEREPRPRHDQLLPVGDQRAPRRRRRLHACAEERQRGLEHDVVRDDQREEDEHRAC